MLLELRLLLSCCLLVGLCSSCGSNNNSNSQTGGVSTTTQTTQPTGVNGSQPATNAPPATTPASQPTEATGGIDACSLLDSKEIAKVQGGAMKETKSSQRNDGDFLMSQCFYTAEEFVRSVSLSVVQPNPANPAKQPREYFTERFGKAGEKSGAEREREEREREREKAKEQREKEKNVGQPERGEEEEEEEGGNAERVSGVGEQAYWVKTGPSASLYVLQKNQFMILSIGGGDAEQVKLRKTKALAQQALKRMK